MTDPYSYPKTAANRFRWDAIPQGAIVEERQLSPRWLDLCWKDDRRKLWVYIATKPSDETIQDPGD